MKADEGNGRQRKAENLQRYLLRVKAGGKKDILEGVIPLYGIDETGTWSVTGGKWGGESPGSPSGRHDLGIVHGSYADTLAWATSQRKFYGSWNSHNDAGSDDAGYVARYEPPRAVELEHDSSLDGIVLGMKLRDDALFRHKTLAWNVDTQYDFMSPLGKLYVQGAEAIEPNLARITMKFRDYDMKIVNSGDWHKPDSMELSKDPDFIHTFPEHCMIGTSGAEYVPATRPRDPLVVDWRQGSLDMGAVARAKDIVLYKDEFDVFAGTPHSEGVLRQIDPDRVIVYGVATNVCVDFAVRGLLQRGKEVYVVEDAIKELPNIPSPVEDWKRLGAKLILTEDLTYTRN